MICWGMFYKNLKDIIICCKSLQANLEDEGGGTVDKLDIQFLQCQTGYCSEEHIDPSMWHKLCGIKKSLLSYCSTFNACWKIGCVWLHEDTISFESFQQNRPRKNDPDLFL